jgi:CRP/FNR family transcriptional regulator, cyclic AMP receptor protein
MRKALYILGILDDEDANWLASNGKARRISAGTVIIQQGVPSNSVFILIDGKLVVHSAKIEIAKLFAGEIVGEISFVDSRPPSATVTATNDSQVLEIDKAALRSKLQKDFGFASRFYLSLRASPNLREVKEQTWKRTSMNSQSRCWKTPRSRPPVSI